MVEKAAEHKFNVLVLNAISPNGLKQLPGERYHAAKDVKAPDAVLVRSADMHSMEIPASEIGRASCRERVSIDV